MLSDDFKVTTEGYCVMNDAMMDIQCDRFLRWLARQEADKATDAGKVVRPDAGRERQAEEANSALVER